jgi:anti-anti-sigma factor
MKRHHLAMTASIGRYEQGAISVPTHRQTAAASRTGPAEPAISDAGFVPTGLVAREHTLILTGELDSTSAHALEAEIERLCEEKVTSITLDLRDLTYIDPVGVAVIAFRCGLCQRRGYGFTLIPGGRMIHRAFEQAGIAGLLPFDEQVAVGLAREQDVAPLRADVQRLAGAQSKEESSAPARVQEGLAVPTLVPALAMSHGVAGGGE